MQAAPQKRMALAGAERNHSFTVGGLLKIGWCDGCGSGHAELLTTCDYSAV